MRWIVALVVVVAGISAVVYVKWDEWMVFPELKSPMLRALLDPGAAQFRDERITGINRTTMCGEINTKNAMGGYTGFKRYVVRPDGYAIEGEGIAGWPGARKPETLQKVSESAKRMLKFFADQGLAPLSAEQAFASAENGLFEEIWAKNCR